MSLSTATMGTPPAQCPFCRAPGVGLSFRHSNEYGTFDILRCTACDIEFTVVADGAVNRETVQKHFFDENLYTIANMRAVHRMWRHEFSIIRRLHPQRARSLDIGCNTGEFLHCVDPSWDRVGIEIADVPADLAAKKGITVHRTPLEECGFADAEFDVVTLFALIEHLDDPRALVAEISRIVKPGGMVVIMTGDKNSWKARLLGSAWHMYIPPLHQFFFSRAALRSVAAEFGLDEHVHRFDCGGMTFSGMRLLNLAEKATLWPFSRLPVINRLPFYDHYYGYFVKRA